MSKLTMEEASLRAVTALVTKTLGVLVCGLVANRKWLVFECLDKYKIWVILCGIFHLLLLLGIALSKRLV